MSDKRGEYISIKNEKGVPLANINFLIDGTPFSYKKVKKSVHCLKTPFDAYAYDKFIFEQLEYHGAKFHVLFEREEEQFYWISHEKFKEKSFEINRGFGDQIAVGLRYWTNGKPPTKIDESSDDSRELMEAKSEIRNPSRLKIVVTKRFSFEAAHFLEGFQGLCSNIHGHSYKLWISVSGALRSDQQEKDMVIELGRLKSILAPLIDALDHSLIVEKHPGEAFKNHRLIIINARPTTEMLGVYLWDIIKEWLEPEGIRLEKLELQETDSIKVEITE